MIVSIEFTKVYKNQYTYYIYKNGEKIGQIIYDEIEDWCEVDDDVTGKTVTLKDTSVYGCVSEIAKAFYYHCKDSKVYLEAQLVNW